MQEVKTTFTPGPWRFKEFGRAGDGPSEFRIGRDAIVVASTLAYDAEAEANARLIAAAPEMYEALEAALRHIENMGRALDACDLLPDFIPQLDDAERVSFQIEAALKKARGE